MIQIINTTPKT